MVGELRLGERAMIDRIVARLRTMPRMPIAFGDDVSGMDLGDGRLAILKCDMLVGKTDVPRGMTLRQAARKSVVMNVSDFACKGVHPQVIMVSLGLPKSTTAHEIDEVAEGLDEGARQYGAYVIGGDTNECDDLVVGCYLLGVAKRSMIVGRNGASPGDLIAVTGEFGKTSAALELLRSSLKVERTLREELLESVYMPNARLAEGMALARMHVMTASMDSSDGLAWSLHEIARASGVGIEVMEIPMAKSAVHYSQMVNLDPLDLALYGGEEFELVVSLKKSGCEKALKAAPSLHIIGEVTRNTGKVTLNKEGGRVVVRRAGWEHFTSRTT